MSGHKVRNVRVGSDNVVAQRLPECPLLKIRSLKLPVRF